MRSSLGTRVAFGLATVAILLAYPIAALSPFNWKSPLVRNLGEVLPSGMIRFSNPGIARTSGPPTWVASAMESNRVAISMRLRPFLRYQFGPARIMSLSADPKHRNLTLGQQRDDLVLRLRTPSTNLNGQPSLRIRKLFREAKWVDLQIEIVPGRIDIYVDGAIRLQQELPLEPLENWDPRYELAFGNEFTGNRPWLGEIGSAAVHVGSLVTDYTSSRLLETPKMVQHFHQTPQLIPFRRLNPIDAIVNLLGFVPLGLLLGSWQYLRGLTPNWRPMAFIVGLSFCLESLQLGIPVRYFSVDDLIFNGAGGAIGLFLVQKFFHFYLSRLNTRKGGERHP